MPTLFEDKDGAVSKVSSKAGIKYNFEGLSFGYQHGYTMSDTGLVTDIQTSDSTRDNIMYDCNEHAFVSTAGAALGSIAVSGILLDRRCDTRQVLWAGTLRNGFNQTRIGGEHQDIIKCYPDSESAGKLEFLLNSLSTQTSNMQGNGLRTVTFRIEGYLIPDGYKEYS